MSTSREELERRLAELKAANEAATSWGAAVGARHEEIEDIERQLRRLAATPKAGVNVTDDSLAKTVTTAVLSALKAGGDNLAIFNAVKQALPSVLGGVDQKTTQTTKPSSSRAEDSASETAVSALAALADELEAAANWMQLYLDTYGEIGDDATQANIDDWHDVVKRARKSSDGGVVATTQASSSMEDKPDPLRRPVGGTINNHLSREAEVAPGPSEANSTAAPVEWYDIEDDDPDVVFVAHAIAEHGVGRPWDDFLPVNAYDMDHGDLTEYARAAVAALRAKSRDAAPMDAGVREALKSWFNSFHGTHGNDEWKQLLAILQLPEAEIQSSDGNPQACAQVAGFEISDTAGVSHQSAVETRPSEANSPAAPVAASIVTCCVTGAIPGDGGACGDCDPCIQGEAFVPEAVKRLIAEKNSLISRIGELEDAAPVDAGVREALDHVLQSLNCLASGLLSPDQNELSTSMASVAAEAIPHAMIIAEALSSQPVVGVDQT